MELKIKKLEKQIDKLTDDYVVAITFLIFIVFIFCSILIFMIINNRC